MNLHYRRATYAPSRCKESFFSVFILFLYPVLLFAQTETGELRLVIKDTSGAAVSGHVELINEATKTRRQIDVPAEGRYSFKNLPFGVYRLSVTKSGFSPASELLEIRSEVPQTRNVKLGVEAVRTSVEVRDSDTLVDPNRTGAAHYIGSQEIKERPSGLPGRGLIDLVITQPGWTLEANGILHPRESEYDTQFVVNGFPVQDNRSPAFARPIEADDVESMKVYTSGIPAEFGNKLGGVIEVKTDRNSSLGFHGTAIAQGGSFDTAGGYLYGQYVGVRTTESASAEGFLTDRYLDPAVQQNYTNHASSTSFTAAVEHDFTDSDRLRVAVINQQTWLQVPNDLLQQESGQRQDRTSGSTEGQVSYQHVFSPTLIGAIRGSVRDVSASLWSNPFSTPISASQDRSYREGYLDGSLSGTWGRHEWKAGAQARFASINEQFGYNIVAYELGGETVFDDNLRPTYNFRGHSPDREQAAYVQDRIRLGNFTVNAGLRFDHYNLLVNETAFSPRLGVSYTVKPFGTVLHASYDRTFGTPPFENLLVSAAPSTRSEEGFYLPLYPSRGNYYEVGFTQAIGRRLRLDANYFRRDVKNFEDDDLLFNTGVSFPIAFHKAKILGTEVKLEMPRWGKFNAFLSYSNTTGTGQYPISGGLFLDDDAANLLNSNARFPISQDIRNTIRARVRYQLLSRLWTAWGVSYTSGLPVEDADELPSNDLLVAQYGSAIVDKVNFNRGRVRPTFSLDASIGVDLWRRDARSVTFQADALNLTDRLNVINFAGLLSGTAIAPPRSFGFRLRTDF